MPVGTVISLFTGAMGLDLGFELEEFETRVVVEKDRAAVDTIRANRPEIRIIMRGRRPATLQDVATEEILIEAGLGVGEATVLLGAPPCEGYSTAGRRNGGEDHRAVEVREFLRVIRDVQPQFFVFEEVDSFVSAAKEHIGFYDRIALRKDEVPPNARLGSFFEDVMAAFVATGYGLSFIPGQPKASILNAADFGVAQTRKRFVLIGTRKGEPVSLPSPSVTEWSTLEDAIRNLNDEECEHKEFPQPWAQYISQVPPGGCWRDLPPDIQKEVLGGAFDDPDNPLTKGKKGGRTGYMRRLSWGKPSPTLTDSPVAKSTCLCHPDLDRPLSVKEYAAIQGFPPGWVFWGSTSAKYRLIGQATPIGLAQGVAKKIKERLLQDTSQHHTIEDPAFL